jgi:hypothetical protein
MNDRRVVHRDVQRVRLKLLGDELDQSVLDACTRRGALTSALAECLTAARNLGAVQSGRAP